MEMVSVWLEAASSLRIKIALKKEKNENEE